MTERAGQLWYVAVDRSGLTWTVADGVLWSEEVCR
jgi:hypothetical protein